MDWFSFFFHILVLFLRLFFFNDPATTEIYTLSLHDALPIFGSRARGGRGRRRGGRSFARPLRHLPRSEGELADLTIDGPDELVRLRERRVRLGEVHPRGVGEGVPRRVDALGRVVEATLQVLGSLVRHVLAPRTSRRCSTMSACETSRS